MDGQARARACSACARAGKACPMTPVGAVLSGAVAGAAGTAAMDSVRYLMYPARRRNRQPAHLGVPCGQDLGAGARARPGSQAASRGFHPAADRRPLGHAHQHGRALGLRSCVGRALRHHGRIVPPASRLVRAPVRRDGLGFRLCRLDRGLAVQAHLATASTSERVIRRSSAT